MKKKAVYITLSLLAGFFAALPVLKAAEQKPVVQIFFQGEAETLPAGSQTILNNLLKQIEKIKGARIIVHAFAAVADQPSWAAQRLALTRALAVRDYLKQNAIQPKRIILKPLGNLCAAPCQRVDIFLKK